ncbi:MAG: VTT domain-containing protein [Candidatus Omnitrophica bacterium]|nr:VTT domain-containing protein [Candidatus Omnitrophota bacterium]
MDLKKYKSGIGFILLVLGIFLLWYLGRFLHLDIQAIRKPLESFPLFVSSFVFVILYVVVTFFVFFSKDIFYLAGALIFGPYLSAVLIFISEALNACILFYCSRYLGRAYVRDSLSGKYQRLDEQLGGISLFWLFIFRAAPLIPYRFLDMAAGLTRMRFSKYFAAVLLGSFLKIFWIQFILYGVGESVISNPNALFDYFLNNQPVFLFSLLYLVLVGMVIYKIRKKFKT